MFISVKVINTFVFLFCLWNTNAQYVSNLGEQCLSCLCKSATLCDHNYGCVGRHCGPFYISKPYWIDAGQHVIIGDHPNDSWAYKNCSLTYECSERSVIGYMDKYGKDCNGDGVTNCIDFLMVHINGGNICEGSLGDFWMNRFLTCNPD